MSKIEVALDIIAKLEVTSQVYIIGHDIPVSISRFAYAKLEMKRREVAKELGIPEDQYEFEDLIMLLTGGMTLEEVKRAIQETKDRVS